MSVTILQPRATRPLRSADVSRLAGVSYRQLDYWCRNGVAVPISGDNPSPGSGQHRRWSRADVRVVVALGRLAALGCRTATLRHVSPMLRAMRDDEWTGQLVVDEGGRTTRTGQPEQWRGRPLVAWLLDLDSVDARVDVVWNWYRSVVRTR